MKENAPSTAVMHELKIWPHFFQAVKTGLKPFEVRKNDRGFKVADILWLREYDPEYDIYTGQNIFRQVSYILDDCEGLMSNVVVLGLQMPGGNKKRAERI